jgi:hypothetical protein
VTPASNFTGQIPAPAEREGPARGGCRGSPQAQAGATAPRSWNPREDRGHGNSLPQYGSNIQMWTIARDGASLLPSAVVAAGTEAAALQRSQEAREDAEAGLLKGDG